MIRPSLDEYMMRILDVVKSRATCRRRQVGAIITDEKGHIISTGYNGSPPGMYHCIDTPCPGVGDAPGDNTKCISIHAEQNAILQAGSRLSIATRLYCSSTPCFACAKLVLCSPIKRVVVREEYADKAGLELLKANGVEVFRYDESAEFKIAGASDTHQYHRLIRL